ncbi:hypothetical protein BH10ACT6_BH10ACT6_06720 [soil metagenome]
MTQAWTDDVARYLSDTTICPRCGTRLTEPYWCATCHADLTGPAGARIRSTSRAAVSALQLRLQYIAALPTREREEPVGAETVAAAVSEPDSVSMPTASVRESSSVSVQSVLAVAGAALVAVAAIVFTFLNPDLTDFGTRTLIVGLVTVVFLGSAWMLVRASLQFSAEAIGALGMVFVALDIWAFSSLAPEISGWVFAGIGTLVGSAVMILIASLARIRTWLWAGLVGVTISPAFFGYAVGSPWGALIGHLGVGVVALLVPSALHRLESRFRSAMRVDRGTSTVIEFLVLAVVLAQSVFVADGRLVTTLDYAGVLLVLAVLAGASSRVHLPRVWSCLAGALVVAAFASAANSFGLAPFASQTGDYLVALIPAAAALGLVIVALLPTPASVHRTVLLVGAWSVTLASALPATAGAFAQALVPVREPSFTADSDEVAALARLLGVAAVSAGSGLLALLAARGARSPVVSRAALGTALWGGALTLLALVAWSGFGSLARALLGLGLVLVLGLALTRLRMVSSAALRTRLPLTVAAHLLLLSTAALAWSDTNLTVAVGAGVVALLGLLAFTAPALLRPGYLGVGYAYALIVFAAGLSLVHVETIAVLCLTTTLASVTALVATLVSQVSVRAWYAVLIVTAVPFLIGIGSVLMVRSGWTALSTGVTFALALTLLLTRRPGLNAVVRTTAAALLVPSLSVVVICVGAQLLDISGSPVTLPIIAVIVACVLPSTGLIGTALERHGIPSPHAAFARVAIEASALVTAVVAVALALVRSAAGLGTTFLVLVIIGIGAATMAFFLRRRYGWAVVFVSWTGALWCVWALAGVAVAEPYILPPALIAAGIAALLVGRGRPGIGVPAIGLFSVGLTSAVLPSLAILAFAGDGAAGRDTWRGVALLAASVVLLVLGALVRPLRPDSRFALLGRLRVPLLLVATVAAAAGPVQAVRWGLGLDRVALSDSPQLMWPVLALSLGSAVLAVVGAVLLVGAPVAAVESWIAGRWSFVPAGLFLVVGPIATTRDGALPIFVLYGLGMALLALMIATVVLARRRTVTLPPVWLLFALAWCVMVASWSTREILRVEGYSLPLGLALLAVGVIAMRPEIVEGGRSATSWPVGFRGSWRLLTPGIVVTLLPSMLATGTDPQTWRAILVLALALASILIGSLRRLGAPFVLGLIVLPIENIVVFAVQLGRSIGATPWWITLATAGAVLLVIAVTSERRSTGEKGVAARLRDLR